MSLIKIIFLAPDAVYLCARFNNQNLILCSELICHDYELQGGLHPYEINIRSKPYKHKKYIYFYIKKALLSRHIREKNP